MDPRKSSKPAQLLVITLMVAAWFSPWWFGGKVLAPLDLLNGAMSPWHQNEGAYPAKNHFVSDAVDQYLVYRMIAAESYRKEGWLGWSSLTYGGTAQYANTMALYSDWTMQLHRWFDFWTAWHLGLLCQMWIAAVGMWWWLQGRKTGALWSVCGSLLFAFNSQFITWIYHRWTLGSFCSVPWILAAMDRHESGSRNHGFMIPAFIALSFLGGTLQHAALVVLVVFIRWMDQAWRDKTTITHPAARPGFSLAAAFRSAASPKLLGRFTVWGSAGLCLSASMWFPCIAAFLESERVGMHIGLHGHAPGLYPGGSLQPVLNFAAYAFQWFPSLLGKCDSLDVLKLFKSELFYVAFFGAIPVIVAFRAVFARNTSLMARMLVASGLILPLTPLVRLLYQRLLVLFILGGILAFAEFMRRADADTRRRLAGFVTWLTGLMVTGWTLVNLIFVFKPDWLAALKLKVTVVSAGGSFGYFQSWFAQRVDRFIDGLFIWSWDQSVPLALLVIGIIGLRLSASSSLSRLRGGHAMLAFACVAEVLWFASGWVVWSDPSRQPLFAETPETSILREKVGHEGRTTTLIHPTAHMALTPFIPNTLAAYGIASIHGYDSIVPDGMLRPFESADDAARLGRLGVTHLITWSGNPEVPSAWTKVWESKAMALYQNPLALPRYIGFKNKEDLETFHAGSSVRVSRLAEQKGLENARQIEVPADVECIRIAENQAAGWQYRVSGTESWLDVSRGPDACMEIQLSPTDKSRSLEMRYDPPMRKLGFWVSGISLLAWLGAFMVSLLVRKSNPA